MNDAELTLPCQASENGHCSALIESLESVQTPNEATEGLDGILGQPRFKVRVIPLCSETDAKACESLERLGGKNRCGRYLAKIAEKEFERNLIYVPTPVEIQRKILRLAATNGGDATYLTSEHPE